MRRRLALLLTATSLGLGGGVATAATASAAPNAHSQNGQCTSAAAGKHLGWSKQADGGRNVGGTCEGPS
jgi:hypothetical protein